MVRFIRVEWLVNGARQKDDERAGGDGRRRRDSGVGEVGVVLIVVDARVSRSR